MATARRGWWKAACSLQREPLNNDELALLTRLSCELTDRWARDGLSPEQGCRATFTAGDLCSLAGCQSLVRARSILRALAAHVGLTFDVQGTRTLVEWQKFKQFQGWTTREPGGAGSKDAPSAHAHAHAHAEEEQEQEKESEPASPGSTPPPKRQAHAVPEVPSEASAFAQDFRDALLKIHAGFKPPSANAFERWRQEARLLLAADKRPPDEARDLASWLFADPCDEAVFWRANVLSVQKFRQKYDQLRAQKQRAEERKCGAAHRGSTLLALAYT